MSEQTRQESPLVSERGSATISEGLVSTLANKAAGEVEGIYLSGSSGESGGVMGRMRGASRGMSITVGRTEVALDLKVGMDYGKDITQTVDEARRRISEEIEGTTGLKVTEFNTTITDIVFPEDQTRRTESPDQTQSAPGGEQTTELDAEQINARDDFDTRRVR